MDRQYEYLFVGDSYYHGFLSDDTGECLDPLAEKRMRQFQIANCRLRNLESERMAVI